MKKLIALGLLVAACLALYLGNFYVSLIFRETNPLTVQIFEDSRHDIPQKYRVFTATRNEQTILVYAVKNNHGIWQFADNSEDEPVLWVSWVTFHYYSSDDRLHYLLYGENAIQPIVIPEHLIPPGVNVQVIQEENVFKIHLYDYWHDDNGKLQNFSQWLREDYLPDFIYENIGDDS